MVIIYMDKLVSCKFAFTGKMIKGNTYDIALNELE